jgi:release factor glutamine methyltransferase
MSRTIEVLVAETTARFKALGIDSARLDSQILLAHVLDVPRENIRRDGHLVVEDALIDAFEKLVAARAERRPISHLTGHREFWSLDLEVTPDTLDPRADSETVVDAALRLLPDRGAAARILDLGTGTGALLLALLTELPQATGIGFDKSEAALAVAKRNAERLHLSDRASFVAGDWTLPQWTAGLDGPFHLIISNPPYIPTRDMALLQPEVRAEPHLALDGGSDGLDAYRILIPALPGLLVKGGGIVFEVGLAQAEKVGSLISGSGFTAPGMARDLSTRARALYALYNRD